MQRRNLVMGLGLGIVFAAGCATQTAPGDNMKRVQREPELATIQVKQDFRALLNADVPVKVSVSCQQQDSYCLPNASIYVVGVNNSQSIVFSIITAPYVFDTNGIQFAEENTYNCASYVSGISPPLPQYRCTPLNPGSLAYHKYTIRVVGTTPNDPFVFTY